MAKYAIIRMEKFQMSDVQGIQKHNQRQGKSKSNLDIDYERSHLNYDLLNDQNLQYEREIKAQISERVKRKPRANSVVLSEFLVTASPDYMKSLSADEQKRYFEQSLDFIKERYGEQNTLYAVVHQDEANPHMHVGVLPITEDGRLSAKDIYNRIELRTLQKEFPEELQRQGFEVERGEEGSKEKHLHPNEYKEKRDLEKEVEEKKRELVGLSETLTKESLEIKVRKEIETKVKQKFLGDAEITKKETGNFVLTPEQMKELARVVNAATAIKKDYERLQTKDLVKENKALEVARDSYHDLASKAQKKNGELLKENQALKIENRDLKAHIGDLRAEIGFLYKSTKEFLKERTEGVRAFKSAFKDFIDKVKEKITGSDFEQLHKRENARERDRGFER